MTIRSIAVLVVGACAVLLLAVGHSRSAVLPSATTVRARWQPSDAVILDRRGRLLSSVRVDDQHRRLEWTTLDDVSPALRAAVIASEDRRFASHSGVDLIAVAGVVGRAIVGDPARGASTISMQVAAMLDPALRRNGARTIAQKWLQMHAAHRLEQSWTKSEILEAYLNLVTFRGELQGVAAATQLLLGKHAVGVTGDEAVVLAALIRAPNAEPGAVMRRALALRDVMQMPVADEQIEATTRRMFSHLGASSAVALAPHAARRLVTGASGRATIPSTLDADVQRAASLALRQQLLALEGKRVRDGAVLVVDNASGDVLAYVGSSGELSSGRYVDAVTAHRQAGSTLKPFLYALAFERRLLTPASLLDDSPLDVPVFGGLYRPENYDEQFNGMVPVRIALAGSLNIPAVRALSLVGGDAFVGQLRRLGFARLDEPGDYYGPALALGAADVSLEELVNAYRTIANGGRLTPLRFRRDDEVHHLAVQTYSEAAAFLTSTILADRDGRSLTFGLESPLATRFWSAVKTGTSKSMRDNWCVGYSQRFTVGVWVGNLSGQPMRGVSGMSGAAPIWIEVMEWLHRDGVGAPPAMPSDVIVRDVGQPARREWFLAGTEPVTPLLEPLLGRDRITSPASQSLVAIDPDIPTTRQRVLFQADTAAQERRWQLDGHDLGPVTATMWTPTAGVHQLSLVTADGTVLDRVSFTVRGPR